MSAKYFLDTNILVYTFDHTVPRKCKVARQLVRSALQSKKGCISSQVVQEFANVAMKKFSVPISAGEVRDYFHKVLKPLCEVQWSFELFLRALSINAEFGYGVYDSLIIAGALRAECAILYSEDFRHMQKIEGLEIVDPFR